MRLAGKPTVGTGRNHAEHSGCHAPGSASRAAHRGFSARSCHRSRHSRPRSAPTLPAAPRHASHRPGSARRGSGRPPLPTAGEDENRRGISGPAPGLRCIRRPSSGPGRSSRSSGRPASVDVPPHRRRSRRRTRSWDRSTRDDDPSASAPSNRSARHTLRPRTCGTSARRDKAPPPGRSVWRTTPTAGFSCERPFPAGV